MPGIAGIICGNPSPGRDRDLALMVETLRHEKFYRGGCYINRELGLYVGWQALTGSFADCMPLTNRAGDIVLIFQGENYLPAALKSRLQRPGGDLREAAAGYLIDLYDETGDEFLRSLNGWFCGMIVDLRRRQMTLFNDRYGMSRVYVHEGNDECLFASEAKALLQVRPALRSIDETALAQQMKFGCVLETRTLFQGVSLLPNASSWIFENGRPPQKLQYFKPGEWEDQTSLTPDEFHEQFTATVDRVIPKYSAGGQKVSMALTGGYDTRLIMAALHGQNRPLPCCTFGGPWSDTYDMQIARRVAKTDDLPFELIRIDDSFFKGFHDFARRAVYLSDGNHDAFGAHDVYFNRLARELAPVRLTGKFGSEVVRSRKLIAASSSPQGLLTPDMESVFENLPSRDELRGNKHPLSRVVFEEIPWSEHGRVAVEQSQLTLRTPYLDNELVQLMYRASYATRSAGRLQTDYIDEKAPELSLITTNLGGLGRRGQNLTRFLYYVYRSWFKVEYVYLFATPHWLTRLDRKLERFELEKRLSGKQKFEAYRIWMKTKFSGFIRDTLLNPAAKYPQFFDKRIVETMVRRHLAGTHNYLNEINRVLTLELVCSSLLNPEQINLARAVPEAGAHGVATISSSSASPEPGVDLVQK